MAIGQDTGMIARAKEGQGIDLKAHSRRNLLAMGTAVGGALLLEARSSTNP
jgi:hypothetical protein